jgi:rod shape-determining protein MreC
LANFTENIKIYLMKPNSKLKFGAVLVLLIALFVVLNLTGGAKSFRGFFYSISSPFQKSLWRAGASVSDFFETVFQIKDLKSENESLKLQNQELSAKLAELAVLKNENDTLRNALDLGLRNDFRLVLTQVISKDIDKDIISINKGAKDGISSGMPVLTGQKVLVGKVTDVSDNFSKVMLITDKSSSFDAKILDSEAEGVLRGGGGFSAILDLIPREAEIKQEDQVMTSALGGIYPQGILVGKIANIEKSDTGSFQKASVLPSFDPKELDNLFIVVNL